MVYMVIHRIRRIIMLLVQKVQCVSIYTPPKKITMILDDMILWVFINKQRAYLSDRRKSQDM